MKPRSIIHFQRLFLGSTLLTIANIFIHYSALRSSALAKGASPAGPILGVIVAMGFYALFRFGIGRIASNVAKWLFVAFTVFSLVQIPINLPETIRIGPSYALLDAFCFVLQLAAATMLFRQDAADWLKGRRSPAEAE